jgi:hypothetical protein
VGSLRQQAINYRGVLLHASVCTSLITDDTHAVTCNKGLRCERPETRIKVKSSTCLPVAPRLLPPPTNPQKLIIPTDETSRPIAKSTHKQLSFAATAECLSGIFLVILATSRQCLRPSLFRLSVTLAASPFSHYLHRSSLTTFSHCHKADRDTTL